MKEHFCPAEQSTITYQDKCNWCSESEGSMNEIIDMARNTANHGTHANGEVIYTFYSEQLVAFANLVAAKATEEANARANASWELMCKKMVAFEREACAKVCETINSLEDYYGERIELACAESIRARGQA